MATLYTVGHGARSAKRNAQFARAVPYREHMKTALFRDVAAAIAALAERVCLMCAETDPETCRRAHIADWMVGRGHRVLHLLAAGRSREHVLHPQEELWRDD